MAKLRQAARNGHEKVTRRFTITGATQLAHGSFRTASEYSDASAHSPMT